MEPQPKKRKTDKPLKRWSDKEVVTILEHIIQEGNLEKPTAQIFYSKLLKATNIDASWDLVRWKVRNLKRLYQKALGWENSTGAGLMGDEDCSSKREKLLKMCPHFDMLSEIFGGKNSADCFHTFESSEVSVNFEENECLNQTITQRLSSDNEFSPTPAKESGTAKFLLTEPTSNGAALLSVLQSTSNSMSPTNLEAPTTSSAAASTAPPTASLNVPSTAPSSTSAAHTPQAGAEFARKMKKSIAKSSIQQLSAVQSQRMEFYEKKLELEKRRLELEERKVERELRLQEEKQKQDFELRKLELEKEERIAKYEIKMKYKMQLH